MNEYSLCRTYNYSSIITPEDTASAISDINTIIDSGNYFKNSPPFQTQQNLFGKQEQHWLKYRMTFLTSVFLYLGKEHRVSDMMAWSFKTNLDTVENRDAYWHHHHKHGVQGLSGIMYLHIPDDVKDLSTCGTEMAPNGPEGGDKFFIQPTEYCWHIYPSETWHRPGIVQSKQYRYILAADVVYY